MLKGRELSQLEQTIPATSRQGPWEDQVDPQNWGLESFSSSKSSTFLDHDVRPHPRDLLKGSDGLLVRPLKKYKDSPARPCLAGRAVECLCCSASSKPYV